MTNQEIIAHQQRAKQFNKTELGNLFNRFVNLHAIAWQLDERCSYGSGETASRKAWEKLEPVERELRQQLMKIVGVEL